MSVIVMARLIRNRDGIHRASRCASSLSHGVADAARERGCLDSRVIASGDEALLIEEWSDTDAFETFFDRTPAYRQAIDEAGFRGFPDDIKVWRQVSGTGGRGSVGLGGGGTAALKRRFRRGSSRDRPATA